MMGDIQLAMAEADALSHDDETSAETLRRLVRERRREAGDYLHTAGMHFEDEDVISALRERFDDEGFRDGEWDETIDEGFAEGHTFGEEFVRGLGMRLIREEMRE